MSSSGETTGSMQRSTAGTQSDIRDRVPNRTLDQDGVRSERLNSLRRSRSEYMSNITRQYNEFQDLATTNVDFALIHAKYKKIKEAFESLSAVHMTLVSELQPEKIEAEKTTYTEAKNKYEEAMRQHRNLKEQHRLQGEVVPEDSVSQVASHTSKASETSSARAKAAAKKAALLVQARYLKQMNEIELQRLDIEQH